MSITATAPKNGRELGWHGDTLEELRDQLAHEATPQHLGRQLHARDVPDRAAPNHVIQTYGRDVT